MYFHQTEPYAFYTVIWWDVQGEKRPINETLFFSAIGRLDSYLVFVHAYLLIKIRRNASWSR